MADENGARLRFRPAGSAARQHGAPEYGPLGTGCPAVEQAVTALYKAQNEESFWTLMNALNYALELDTRVLVPLQAAPDSEKGGASWAEHPVPAEKARDLPLWTLRTQKGKNYLPIFTSVKTAEADRGTAARPMAELLLVDAMQKVLDSKEMDGIVLDPWTTSATLDASLLNGLLHASRDTDEPGEEELHKGSQAALAGQWADALHYYEQAAEQGRAEALSMLGELLYEGKGVRRSAVQARRMWKKAAEAGDVLVSGVLELTNDSKEVAQLWYTKADADVWIVSTEHYENSVNRAYRLHAAGAAPDGPIRDTVPLPAPGAGRDGRGKAGVQNSAERGRPCRGAVAAGDGRRHPRAAGRRKTVNTVSLHLL